MAETPPPKTSERSKLGPIPLDHFGNDPRFNPDVDLTMDKDLRDQIAKIVEDIKNSEEPDIEENK